MRVSQQSWRELSKLRFSQQSWQESMLDDAEWPRLGEHKQHSQSRHKPRPRLCLTVKSVKPTEEWQLSKCECELIVRLLDRVFEIPGGIVFGGFVREWIHFTTVTIKKPFKHGLTLREQMRRGESKWVNEIRDIDVYVPSMDATTRLIESIRKNGIQAAILNQKHGSFTEIGTACTIVRCATKIHGKIVNINMEIVCPKLSGEYTSPSIPRFLPCFDLEAQLSWIQRRNRRVSVALTKAFGASINNNYVIQQLVSLVQSFMDCELGSVKRVGQYHSIAIRKELACADLDKNLSNIVEEYIGHNRYSIPLAIDFNMNRWFLAGWDCGIGCRLPLPDNGEWPKYGVAVDERKDVETLVSRSLYDSVNRRIEFAKELKHLSMHDWCRVNKFETRTMMNGHSPSFHFDSALPSKIKRMDFACCRSCPEPDFMYGLFTLATLRKRVRNKLTGRYREETVQEWICIDCANEHERQGRRYHRS